MSERPLEVGEIGIIQNMIHAVEMNGCIAEVIKPLQLRKRGRNIYTQKITINAMRLKVRYAYPNRFGKTET